MGDDLYRTPDQARKKACEFLAVARTGIDPARARSKERKVPDFKTFAYRYLDEEATSRLKPATIQNYEINIRKHAIPFIGPLKLTEITRAEIQQLHSTIGRRTKIQANRTVETISAVYRYAQTLGIVEEGYNPTNGITANYLTHGMFCLILLLFKIHSRLPQASRATLRPAPQAA